MAGPATFVVALLIGVMLVAGALILGSNREKPPVKPGQCPACKAPNVSQARFCARCGQRLPKND